MKMEENVKEKRQHSSSLIPYSYYRTVLPDLAPVVSLHWHQEWELNYISNGEGIVRLGDSEAKIRCGDIVLICPEVLHAIETDQTLCCEAVVFRTGMFGGTEDRSYAEILFPLCNGASKFLPIQSNCCYYDKIKKCVETILFCAKENRADSDLLMKAELLRLLFYVCQTDCMVPETDILQSEEIRKTIDFMEINYMEPVTIEELARQANLSKSYFMRRFREFAGMGAVEYLNKLRIQKACMFIGNGKSISEAALSSGFRNLSNFNRHFKLIVGCTPMEYKKSLKKYWRQERQGLR